MTLINHSVTLTIVVLGIFRFVTALNRGRIVLNEFHEKGVIDCLQEVDLQCLKSRIVTNMYKLWNTKSLELMDSVKVKYDGDQRTPLHMTRAIVTNDWTDLLNRIPELIKHMSLEINVLPDSHLEEGRRKKFGFFHELVRGKLKQKTIRALFVLGGLYSILLLAGIVSAKVFGITALLGGKVAILLGAIEGIRGLINKRVYNLGYIKGYYDSHGNDYQDGFFDTKQNPFAPPSKLFR